jgi:hypothetical protein
MVSSVVIFSAHLARKGAASVRFLLCIAVIFAEIKALSCSLLPDGTIAPDSDQKIMLAQRELFECYEHEHTKATKNNENVRYYLLLLTAQQLYGGLFLNCRFRIRIADRCGLKIRTLQEILSNELEGYPLV